MIDNTPLHTAAQALRGAQHVVVFSGTGVSAESGIPTFRDADGLWQKFPPDEFGHWPGILQCALWKPRRLAAFVHAVLEPIAAARPNAAHLAIAELERFTRVTVVTQNVDGLHQQAGSTTVREVHGSLLETATLRGRFERLVDRREMQRMIAQLERARRSWLAHARLALAVRPLLGVSLRGVYRPAVVLLGEGLAEPAWTQAQRAAAQCDLMITIGTSGAVFPAALLPLQAREHGATVITIDPAADDGDLSLRGSAGKVVPRLIEAAFGDSVS